MASETSALLPQGIQDGNYTYLVTVSASDLYAASTTSYTNVTVQPYHPTPGTLWNVAVQRAMSNSTVTHWHTAADGGLHFYSDK